MKRTYEKERYLNLKSFEIGNGISEFKRCWSNELVAFTGKWYKIKKTDFNLNATEDEFNFLNIIRLYNRMDDRRESTLKFV